MPPRPPATRPALRSGPRRGLAAVLLAPTVVVLAACGSGGSSGAPPSTAASAPAAAPGTTPTDADFVRRMLPHHDRALEVGALMAARGADPRVREFGQRIRTEQTPERDRLQSWVRTLGLTPQPGDAAMATGVIDDAALARLRGESGAAFDRDALLTSATSESGAADMSATELASGTYPPARELARAISTAPAGEIPALRGLAARLG